MSLKIDKKLVLIPKILGYILLAIVAGCMVKVFFWEQNYYKNKSYEERAEVEFMISDVKGLAVPDESEISEEAYDNHQTGSNIPQNLNIKRLDTHARIMQAPVNDQSLQAPSNIFDLNWYAGSSRPGMGGKIILVGYKKGQHKDGALAQLESLEKGDIININNGLNQNFDYECKENFSLPVSELQKNITEIQKSIENQETLILLAMPETKLNGDPDQGSIQIVKATLK